jgi:hypothetical protein
MDVVTWTAKLLVTAALLGGYPQNAPAPPVHVVDRALLMKHFCGSPCTIKGAYLHGQGVLIAASLDIDGNPMDRSVLLHELVHYLQDINGRFRDDGPCDRWKEREIEAYTLQDSYLARYNMGIGGAMESALQFLPVGCTLAGDSPQVPSANLFQDGQP